MILYFNNILFKQIMKKYYYFFWVFIFSMGLISCAGQRFASQGEVVPLENKYRKIIFEKFTAEQSLAKAYFDEINACENTALVTLLKKSSISRIEKANISTSRESGAVIIKTHITALKINTAISSTGLETCQGNSEMAVDLTFIDAETGKTIFEKHLSTISACQKQQQTAVSDHSLTSALGKIIAQYIADVIRND
jgi:hypothetical protein